MEAAASPAGKKWYVVTTYSGYENKVKGALQERIRQFHLEEKFGEILIPSEQVTDTLKDGRQRVKAKTSFPGYIFVEMEMSEHAWHIVKDTPKVTGFIGNNRPQEVKPPHIEDIRKGIGEGAVKPKPRHRSGSEAGQAEAQGHGQHLRAPHARRARLFTRGEALRTYPIG
jgi:transcription antitermination factor NusG